MSPSPLTFLVLSHHDQGEDLTSKALGSEESTGMSKYHLSMSGRNGILSYISTTRNSFIGVTLTRNQIATVQLHGVSDASKIAYTAVVYSRMIDAFGSSHLPCLSQDQGSSNQETDDSTT